MTVRNFIIAAVIAAIPVAAFAQQTTGPDVGAASKEANVIDQGSANSNADNSKVSGATGRTVVAGSSSTAAGDNSAAPATKTTGGSAGGSR